jgi:subtilisin family serine protease
VRLAVAAGILLTAAGCAAVTPASLRESPALAAADGRAAARQILVTLRPLPSWRLPRAGSTLRGYDSAYRTSARTQQVVSALAQHYGLREVSSWPIGVLGVHCVVFEVPADSTPPQVAARLEKDRRVESAQPMHVFTTQSAGPSSYNDPYRELQYGVSSMQVEEAHRFAEGDGVEIALVDTGVEVQHPDLEGHIVLVRDFVGGPAGEPHADYHGTAVAGIIASSANNGIGIVGVAPRARLLALRACWQEAGDSILGVCNSFTLAKALSFAVERRPQIINLSLAGPVDPLLERLVRVAVARGIVVVAAAGDSPTPEFPAGVEGVLSVRAAPAPGRAALGRGGAELAREGGGETYAGALTAPGVDVITTTPRGAFDFVSGSSVAAAHVSGVAALLLERRPQLVPDELRRLLQAASLPVDDSAGAALLVNACAALAKVVPQVRCPVVTPSRV